MQKYLNNLRARAIFGLCVIGVFVITSQLFIFALVIQQTSSSRVVNLAGRQRMLSQQLTKNALILRHSTDTSTRSASLDELSDTLQSWERVHQGLQDGNRDLGLPDSNSVSVSNLFDLIETDYQQILTSSSCILVLEGYLDDSDLGCNNNLDFYLQLILSHEQAFLIGMDAIVFQYDTEAQNSIRQIQRFGNSLALFYLAGIIYPDCC
ncbi:MAG: type IV pili methyl-accepting chemotaxis transducer N-terminal domain-containing protein [Chloroflexota bacterium]